MTAVPIGLSLCMLALLHLPLPMVTNRQMGVLRRFATTPAPPSWLLAAQVIINLVLAPKQNLAPLAQHIGNYTPLGAAVQAMDAAMQGNFPPARPLLVMVAYAVVFGIAAIRLFRWE